MATIVTPRNISNYMGAHVCLRLGRPGAPIDSIRQILRQQSNIRISIDSIRHFLWQQSLFDFQMKSGEPPFLGCVSLHCLIGSNSTDATQLPLSECVLLYTEYIQWDTRDSCLQQPPHISLALEEAARALIAQYCWDVVEMVCAANVRNACCSTANAVASKTN